MGWVAYALREGGVHSAAKMARPRRTFLGEDAETWKMILMVWAATFVLTVLYEETMLARRAEQELLARQVTLRSATTTTARREPALAAERSAPRAQLVVAPASPANASSLAASLREELAAAGALAREELAAAGALAREELAAAGELARKDLAAVEEAAAAAAAMARGDLAAASDLARREVVAASTYAGPLLALVDMLLAAGTTAALFYTIWRCAGAAGDAAATDGRKAHTI